MGYMHFWGLTIDVVSSVIIIISIGLCVDYSAHIAHAFLSVQGAILHTYLLFFAHCSKIWETKCNLVKFLESVKNYIKETYYINLLLHYFSIFWGLSFGLNQISTYLKKWRQFFLKDVLLIWVEINDNPCIITLFYRWRRVTAKCFWLLFFVFFVHNN